MGASHHHLFFAKNRNNSRALLAFVWMLFNASILLPLATALMNTGAGVALSLKAP